MGWGNSSSSPRVEPQFGSCVAGFTLYLGAYIHTQTYILLLVLVVYLLRVSGNWLCEVKARIEWCVQTTFELLSYKTKDCFG